MKLTLGFSPCPNDTFIFDALVNNKIETEGIEFEVLLEDVQTLNQWALQAKLDISKISYGVLPQILDNYLVLESGGALGKGVGPLLVYNTALPYHQPNVLQEAVEKQTIAIPGENTTANFLFSRAFPNAKKKIFLRFDQIEDWVLEQRGLGVIIHENRFTYANKGLHKWADLGELWEKTTGLPIPLGGIVAKKTIPKTVLQTLNHLIQNSIQYARKNYPPLPEFVTLHAQEMEPGVMQKHIDLYVNEYSLSLGDEGKAAVHYLFQNFNAHLPPVQHIFL